MVTRRRLNLCSASYNDAYKPTALAKHPRVLGLPVAVAWPEVYPTLQASIENAFLGEHPTPSLPPF